MCVSRNIVERSRNVYASSIILTASQRFARTEHFYDDSMSPATAKSS